MTNQAETAPSPARGEAEVAENMSEVKITPVSTETGSSETPVTTLERATKFGHNIKQLPEQADAFDLLYDSLSEANDLHHFIAPLNELVTKRINAGEEKSPLTDAEKPVFNYMRAELLRANYETVVDMDAFNKPTVAFPGEGNQPKIGKSEYIIEDLSKQLDNLNEEYNAATDEKTKQDVKKGIDSTVYQLETMKRFVANLKDGEQSDGTEVKDYVRLATTENADSDELNAATTKLNASVTRLYAEGAAYGIIQSYFPSEKSRDIIVSASMYAHEAAMIAGMDESSQEVNKESAAVSESSSDKAPGLVHITETTPKSLDQLTIELSAHRKRLAKKYAKREKSSLPLGLKPADRSKEMKYAPHEYNSLLWNALTEQLKGHSYTDEQMADMVASYVVHEAKQLEDLKDEHFDQEDINRMKKKDRVFGDKADEEYVQALAEFAEEMINEIDKEKGIDPDTSQSHSMEDWEEVFKTLQRSMQKQFDEKIKYERTSNFRKNFTEKYNSERSKNVRDNAKNFAKRGKAALSPARLWSSARKKELVSENKRLNRERKLGVRGVVNVMSSYIEDISKKAKERKPRKNKSAKNDIAAVAAATNAGSTAAASIHH